MDTETMIKQMMQAHRMPIDRMKQKQQTITWQRDAYREMNTMMAQLRDTISTLRFESTTNAKKVTTGTTAVTATATSDTTPGAYALTIHQMASAATITGNAVSSTTGPLNTAGDTVLTVNGVDITITQNSTANNVVTALNAKTSQTGVKASFDAVTQRITLTHNQTGSTSAINIAHKSGDASLLTNMNLGTASATGQQAIVDYNGVSGLTFDTNSFKIEGINFTLKPTAGATYPINVNVAVSADTDKVFDTIKSFVSKYNELIDKVQKKTSEARYRDFQPLTDDQRKEMKEDEIKQWEEKAKSGMLRNDATLKSAVDKMRTALMEPVTGLPAGSFDMLSDIGISTSKPGTQLAYKDNGKLYLDENKLREALETNPEQVSDLLTKGYADRLYKEIDTTITRLTKLAGSGTTLADNSNLSLQLRDLDRNISVKTSGLKAYEDKYYKQFASLETAIQTMNSQSAWLSQQFSSM
ncbi:flagellar filament capping protein FliD [Tumebacillus sp. DT12]|uniref:Flagellar hook-associated protein 2 n=2 Tax=Tumebacillus lacus TaxID=2995335 RepID=A0ABT3WXQ8_9BACL|nr:flagellar filament capping protein FliD [Tumebacillus lacus]